MTLGRKGGEAQQSWKGHVKYFGLRCKINEKPCSCLNRDWHGKLHFTKKKKKRSFQHWHIAHTVMQPDLKVIKQKIFRGFYRWRHSSQGGCNENREKFLAPELFRKWNRQDLEMDRRGTADDGSTPSRMTRASGLLTFETAMPKKDLLLFGLWQEGDNNNKFS